MIHTYAWSNKLACCPLNYTLTLDRRSVQYEFGTCTGRGTKQACATAACQTLALSSLCTGFLAEICAHEAYGHYNTVARGSLISNNLGPLRA